MFYKKIEVTLKDGTVLTKNDVTKIFEAKDTTRFVDDDNNALCIPTDQIKFYWKLSR